jgi:hypothetical protein
LAAVPLLSDYLSRFSGEFAGRMAKMGLTNHGLAKMSTRASRPICPCRQVPANGTLRLNMSIQAIELFTQFDANKVRLDAILRAVQKNVRKRYLTRSRQELNGRTDRIVPLLATTLGCFSTAQALLGLRDLYQPARDPRGNSTTEKL